MQPTIHTGRMILLMGWFSKNKLDRCPFAAPALHIFVNVDEIL
jgi:hypothetical protein